MSQRIPMYICKLEFFLILQAFISKCWLSTTWWQHLHRYMYQDRERWKQRRRRFIWLVHDSKDVFFPLLLLRSLEDGENTRNTYFGIRHESVSVSQLYPLPCAAHFSQQLLWSFGWLKSWSSSQRGLLGTAIAWSTVYLGGAFGKVLVLVLWSSSLADAMEQS